MPSEIDINLIFLRLEKLEERIKVLEADKLKSDDYYQVKAGPATKPNPAAKRPEVVMSTGTTKGWVPQWEEDLK